MASHYVLDEDFFLNFFFVFLKIKFKKPVFYAYFSIFCAFSRKNPSFSSLFT